MKEQNIFKSYSWLEIANMPLCCVCCGSRNVDQEKDVCLNCGADEGFLADERTDNSIKDLYDWEVSSDATEIEKLCPDHNMEFYEIEEDGEYFHGYECLTCGMLQTG